MNASLVFLLTIAGAVYLAPSITAFARSHPNRWLIAALNVFGGLTVLGWVLALLWALQAIHKSPRTALGSGTDGGESGLNVFANDDRRVVVKSSADPATQLRHLKELADSGTISPEEFAVLKADVIRGTRNGGSRTG